MKLGRLLESLNPLGGGGGGGEPATKMEAASSTTQNVTVNPITNVTVAPPVITTNLQTNVQAQDLSPIQRAVESIVHQDTEKFKSVERVVSKFTDERIELSREKEVEAEFLGKKLSYIGFAIAGVFLLFFITK